MISSCSWFKRNILPSLESTPGLNDKIPSWRASVTLSWSWKWRNSGMLLASFTSTCSDNWWYRPGSLCNKKKVPPFSILPWWGPCLPFCTSDSFLQSAANFEPTQKRFTKWKNAGLCTKNSILYATRLTDMNKRFKHPPSQRQCNLRPD